MSLPVQTCIRGGLLFKKAAVISLFLIVFGIFGSGTVQALGLGVAPHRLDLEVYPLGSASGQLNVINNSDEEGLYRVYVEGENEAWFDISPQEFILEPGNHREVELIVAPPLIAHGEYEVMICVVSLSSAADLKIGCGMKVPVNIVVLPPSPEGMISEIIKGSAWRWLIILTATVIIIIVAVKRRHRTHGV